MSQLKDVVRLLRLPNLLVVAATMLLVYYHVLRDAFAAGGVGRGVMSDWQFGELLGMTLLITLAGYLVNDLRDFRIDEENRPGVNPIYRIGRPIVVFLYITAVLVGWLLSISLAFRLGERSLLFIYPLAVGTLTLYSVWLKKVPFVGNLIVALFCAGVPGVLVLADRESLLELFVLDAPLAATTLQTCLLFMSFAFVATLLRELVKDIEDVRGDRAAGRRTLPVLLGEERSRWLAIGLGVLVILSMLTPVLLNWPTFRRPPMLATIAFLLLALLVMLYQLTRARTQVDYGRLSSELKLFLLGGLCLLIFA